MQDIVITTIQAGIIHGDPAANREYYGKLIDKIETKPDIIFLPEMFNTGFPADPHEFAEGSQGESFHWLRKMASKKNTAIVGSLLYKEQEKFHNSIVWMQADKSFSTYHKRHVFYFGDESEQTSKGEKKEIIEYKGWKFCPQICYDLRFPVWSRNNYKDGVFEYDVLFYLANWPDKRRSHWKQLLIARAIENQSYVIGVNRIGKDKKNINYTGDTMVVSPEGKVLYQAEENVESIHTTRLSFDIMNTYRNKFRIAGDWDYFELKL